MAICVSIGLIASILFYCCVVKEDKEESNGEEQTETHLNAHQMSVLDWVKEPQIYQVRTLEI